MADRWLVVGAGSAGCVVARRLSDDPGREVTLLEAGPGLDAAGVPPAVSGADFFAALAMSERTYPDLVATHRDGRRRPYPRGRGVGGSSAVNAMVALHPSDPPVAPPGVRVEPHLLTIETVGDDELGAVDRALLAAAPDAERARLTRAGRRRVTSAEAYLWPVAERPNLTVRSGTPVDRIVFHPRRPDTAAGVRLVTGEELDADHVVLCAGAIHSPAILLRSGIDGGKVGRGLQDHPSLPLALALAPGAVAAAGALAVGALLRRGDLQVLPLGHLGSGTGMGMLMPALMRPRGARGAVALDPDAPDDPRRDPAITFDLAGDPHDLARLVAGVHLAVELLAHPAFTSIVEEVFVDEHGTPLRALTDDDAIATWATTAVGDYVHASGTCAIGRVVATDGSVFGHRGLHVCDASVFPTIPDVNTHVPVTLLAETMVAVWRAASPA